MQLTELLRFFPVPYSLCGKTPTDYEVKDIISDSRKAEPGDIFICLSGTIHNGRDYATDAFHKGCLVIVTDQPLSLPENATQIITKSPRQAMLSLCLLVYQNPSRELHIIGITGTKGKTTTALLVHHVLQKNGLPTGYIGTNGISYAGQNYPTVNTTPDCCELQKYLRQMVEAGVRYVVLEVSSQALKLARTKGIRFACTVFTNFSPDHIGRWEHPDLADYRHAKSLLFSKYETGAVIYNADDDAARDIISGASAPRISFSLHEAADFTASDIHFTQTADKFGVQFTVRTPKGVALPAYLPLPGLFNVSNALCALAICAFLGLSAKNVLTALADACVAGRFEVYRLPSNATAVIDYAHNGLSLRSALETLRAYTPKRLICLFGSVGGRTQNRRRDMGKVASELCDLCILTADNPDNESPESIIKDIASAFGPGSCPHIDIPDRRQAIRYAVSIAGEGDILLLAGKGHERVQRIAGVDIPFSEIDLLREFAGQKVPNTP